MSDLAVRFAEITGRDSVLVNELMSTHTTFRIGGPVDYLLIPHNEAEIAALIRVCKENEIPFFVMGNGSNLLVSDSGFRGAVIRLGREFGAIEVKDDTVFAKAGALLSQTAAAAAEHSLRGLEFAAGIPGTLGGACMMNAGAYGGEMKQVLESVTALDSNGVIRKLAREELGLGYRTSIFMRTDQIVLSAEMKLEPGDQEEIRAVMADLRERRQSKQPLELPSAGSTFRRPEGYFAGKLIMDAGLRGFRIGGAQVSEKHCGFVVNTGGAAAADVVKLIEHIQKTVEAESGVKLETEVRFLGEF